LPDKDWHPPSAALLPDAKRSVGSDEGFELSISAGKVWDGDDGVDVAVWCRQLRRWLLPDLLFGSAQEEFVELPAGFVGIENLSAVVALPIDDHRRGDMAIIELKGVFASLFVNGF
jgi:hypothetical protein